jgi:hypothetical protein
MPALVTALTLSPEPLSHIEALARLVGLATIGIAMAIVSALRGIGAVAEEYHRLKNKLNSMRRGRGNKGSRPNNGPRTKPRRVQGRITGREKLCHPERDCSHKRKTAVEEPGLSNPERSEGESNATRISRQHKPQLEEPPVTPTSYRPPATGCRIINP